MSESPNSLASLQVFCVQDRSGTAAQLTVEGTNNPVVVGDQGVYTGYDFEGNAQSLDFTVGAVNDDYNFCITTITPDGKPGNWLNSAWPAKGFITWLSGDNILESPNETVVIARNVANAYIDADFLAQYNNSRGKFTYASSPNDEVWQAIVQATDYIDQRYRFKGIKLFQFLSDNPAFDQSIGFIDPWLASFGFLGGWPGNGPGTNMQGWFIPASTFQHTQWPRQGVVDYSGDTVYGVPLPVQQACAELALRALNGVTLQADYDPTIVGNGGVLSSFTNEVGPIKQTRTYDTKLGLGFFPDFPQVKRILTSAGLIVAGGGRSIVV